MLCASISGFDPTRLNRQFIASLLAKMPVLLVWNNPSLPCPDIGAKCLRMPQDLLDNKYVAPLSEAECSEYLLMDDDVVFSHYTLECLSLALHNTSALVSAPLRSMRTVRGGKLQQTSNRSEFHAAVPQLLLVRREALLMYARDRQSDVGRCDDFAFAKVLYACLLYTSPSPRDS